LLTETLPNEENRASFGSGLPIDSILLSLSGIEHFRLSPAPPDHLPLTDWKDLIEILIFKAFGGFRAYRKITTFELSSMVLRQDPKVAKSL